LPFVFPLVANSQANIMRAVLWGLAIAYAPVALAVPHGKFCKLAEVSTTLANRSPVSGGKLRHQHPARRVQYKHETVTDVVTVTAHNAIVWVDQFSNVLSTEFQGQPTHSPSAPDVGAAFATAIPPVPAAPEDPPPEASTNIPDSSAALATSAPAPPSPAYASPPPASVPTEEAYDANTPAPSSEVPGTAPTTGAQFVDKGSKAGDNEDGGSGSENKAAGGGFGIDFELIGSNGCKTQVELNSEFGFLSSEGFSKIRFYDIGCDLSVATAAAAAAGFSVTLGLNTINNVAGDLGTLIAMIKGNWGPIDTVVIGNEVVNNGGSSGAVAAAVNSGRAILQTAGFTKNVVAVDTYMAHQSHPEICAASDYCAVNAHAFFDANTQASDAGSFVKSAISRIQNNGKAIIVTESGWPYQGNANSVAVPSRPNQLAAIASLKQAFAGNPGSLFLFQAYDATYKSPGAYGVEPYFGIYR
jgi:exo-beta-1,3-glucanase (GH17 family)